MDDRQIVNLYWSRDEAALSETDKKYGRYLSKIAHNILCDIEDVEECVNDTYMRAWNTMPQHRPDRLNIYLGKIVRGFSVDLFRRKNAEKRRSSQYSLSLCELEECVSGKDSTVSIYETELLSAAINRFLFTIDSEERSVFICRYFFLDSISEIAVCKGCSQSKIKSLLFRTRKKLKNFLESEGFEV